MRTAAPGFERWLGHVFDVMGGFMVAAGAMTVLAAWGSRARPERAGLAALSLAGAAGIGLMSVTNFILGSDFRWLLLLPALLWVVGLACHVYEDVASQRAERPDRRGLIVGRTPSGKNRRNPPMSCGSMASQSASMWITAATRAATPRNLPNRPSASSR